MDPSPPPAAIAPPDTLALVRPQVRDLLLSVPAYARLMPAEQQAIANNMVKVAAYMANPDGALADGGAPATTQLARAQAGDPTTALKSRLAGDPGFAGQEFEAGAVKQGVEQFGQLVKKVDFPRFVGGLIQNVFQAIVDSSIQQMRAYGELIANVAKTVDDFARDNITENNARDWLSARFPDALGIETSSMSTGFAEGADAKPSPVLAAKGDDPEQQLAAISKEVGLDKPVTDISDAAEEQRLVLAARLQMARSRQQLLASMVMLGINRIVVTDGSIRAKVIFDMRAQDIATRAARASMHDQESQSYRETLNVGYGSWFSPVSASAGFEGKQEHVATVASAVDESSTSMAEVKANLSGEVRVNFKSDYLPLEKMASVETIAAIQGNAVPPPPQASSSGRA